MNNSEGFELSEEIFETKKGEIHYWKNEFQEDRLTLFFLPGLTANHRLFDKQISYFMNEYNIFTWDAPGHGCSRPFELSFTIEEIASYLNEIIRLEKIEHPVICGQSMGGYIGQGFMQRYPKTLAGYISIDSPPLQRKYMTKLEIWMLKHTEPFFNLYSWDKLLEAGAKGCAQTEYGVNLMKEMMGDYTKEQYVPLMGYGYKIVAKAVEANLPYEIDCPALILCGEHDKAGLTKRYITKLSKREQVRVHWIPKAGHNSNSDNPKVVNELIANYMNRLKSLYIK